MSAPERWLSLASKALGLPSPIAGEMWRRKSTGAVVRIITSDCIMDTSLHEWECVANMPTVIYVHPGQRISHAMVAPEFLDEFERVDPLEVDLP